MIISVRKNSIYKQVTLEHGDLNIDLGLLDEEEAVSLAKELLATVELLLPPEYESAEGAIQNIRETL